MLITCYANPASPYDFNAFDAAGGVWRPSLAAYVPWADADFAAYRIAADPVGASGEFRAVAPAGAVRYVMRARGATLALSRVVWAADLAATAIDPRGPGADQVTLTIYANAPTNTVPLPDADVWVTTDPAGRNTYAGTLQTDSAGEVLFLLDAGNTYYLWVEKGGANPIRGEEFTAVADA